LVERSEYRKLLEERRSWYKTIKKVYCPCLKADVVFNSRGFRHVQFDGDGKERSTGDKVKRLNLLPHSVVIIREAEIIDDHRSYSGVEFWAFKREIAGLGQKVIVVLKRAGNGNIAYVSVMTEEQKRQKDRQ